MIRCLSIISLFCLYTIANGQPGPFERKNLLTKSQVADLNNLLSKKIEDTTRIDILLRLAKYNFEKYSNVKTDLDSATSFIVQAREVNDRQSLRNRDGIVFLYEARLARRQGNKDAGRQLLNKAITKLQANDDEFHLAEAYLELFRFYETNEPQYTSNVKKAFDDLFQHVSKLTSQKQRDSCLSLLMNYYLLQLQNESASVRLDFLEHMAHSHRGTDVKIREFWIRKEVADLHYQQGKLDLAINEALQIAKEQKEGGYPRICFTYDLLSGLYYAGANSNKALYYSLEAVKNVRSAEDSLYLPNFYDRVAFNYSRTGSTSDAIDWNFKSLNYRITAKQTGTIYSLMYDLTGDLIKLDRTKEALALILDKRNKYLPEGNWEKNYMLLSLAKCYVALHKYDAAEQYCEELISLDEVMLKQKEANENVILHDFLANFYFDIGKYDKAEKYFKKTVDEWPKSGRDLGLLFQHYFLFKLDSVRGNYLSSIKHLKNYQLIKDSIETIAKTKQIDELKIAYKTEQKDSLISLKEQNIQLLTARDDLQKSKLQQGAILRNIGFAVVALLIIIIALLYNRYRIKQRTNRKLESQQAEIEKQNVSLHHLVDEKDWLLKEIHHRVKNNLQIVMSLLNSQSAYIDNQSALTAIHDSQHRVHAMSLIHQKLYNSENVAAIDLSLYIRELTSYLVDSFNASQRIRFEFAIEPLEMDVGQAVPLGLILNEAITNSIKYAFPNNGTGVISISLFNTSANHYLLTIADNGIGMPPDFTGKKLGSLGMSLMEGLSEDLGGKFSIENKNGTIIKISFVHDLSVKRPDIFAQSFVSNN